MTSWHIVTGEYPPQPGGVSDYTSRVARGLVEAGDTVDVWAPEVGCDRRGSPPVAPGVTVHRLPGPFTRRALDELGRELDRRPAPRRLLVQYVPHAFGRKGANVAFCRWLARRRQDDLWVMFHEVAFPMGAEYSIRQNLLGLVNRSMARTVARAAARVFVSVPAWRHAVEPLVSPGTPVTWLPVPSSIPVVADSGGAAVLRAACAGGRPLVGHFGTFGRLVRPLLDAVVPAVLAGTDACLLLIGRGSRGAADALVARHPGFADRVVAAGDLSPADISRHLAACDVMLQPYPDGVSTRRTSAMAVLAHGRPMVTTVGWLTEPLWAESKAVLLASAEHAEGFARAAVALVAEPARWPALAERARALYEERFSLRHTIDRLRA